MANPSHIYNAPGTYTVTLTVTDGDGLTDTDTATVWVVGTPPVAEANGPYGGNAGQEIAFSSAGTFDPDGTIVSYIWDWGDSSPFPGVIPNPKHTYSAAGIYVVTLTVTDNDGATATDTATVFLTGNPRAEANGPYTGYVGQLIAFSSAGTYDYDGTIDSYIWDWGDSSPFPGVIANPGHVYTTAGTKSVMLTVTDNDGNIAKDVTSVYVLTPPHAEANGPYHANPGESITFSSTGSSFPASCTWDWGDGSHPGAGNSPVHTYGSPGKQVVTLTVTDIIGGTATDTADVFVNAPPLALANGPYAGKVNELISFTSAGSADPDGTIDMYVWDWGDSSRFPGVIPNPGHRYVNPGTYTVSLTITDNDGLTATDTATVVVTEKAGAKPHAEANGPYSGKAGQEITFSSAGSSDPDGTIASYLWNWGDSTPAGVTQNPGHRYGSPGTYTVSLTVTDNDSLIGVDTAVVYVTSNSPGNPNAEANGPYSGDVGELISFSSAGSADPDGSLVSYVWDWGDSTVPGRVPNPGHRYTTPGMYTVTLTVTDNDGLIGVDTATVNVNIPPPPVPEFPSAYIPAMMIGGLLLLIWRIRKK
jgi:PKD repeat protein